MFVSIFLRGAARMALWLGFVGLLAGASWAQDATPPDTQTTTPAAEASAPAAQSGPRQRSRRSGRRRPTRSRP